MTWQKTKERLAEAVLIAGGLVVLVLLCLLIFTIGMAANNVLHLA